MKGTAIVAALVIAAAAAFAVYQNPELVMGAEEKFETRFLAACEDTLKKRLRSPSSYLLLDANHYTSRDVSFDEYMGWDLAPEQKRRREAFAAKDDSAKETLDLQRGIYDRSDKTLSSVLIRYEAANGFGASIANTAVCKTDRKGEFRDLDATWVRVNGSTNLEWTTERALELAN